MKPIYRQNCRSQDGVGPLWCTGVLQGSKSDQIVFLRSCPSLDLQTTYRKKSSDSWEADPKTKQAPFL